RGVEFSRRGKVTAKRLFDNNADPGVSIRRPHQAGSLNLCDHLGINGRGRRKIVQAIALQVAFLIEFFEAAREFLKRVRLVVISGDVDKGLRESAQALTTALAACS